MFGLLRRSPATPAALAAKEVLQKKRESVMPALPSTPVFATSAPVVGVLVEPWVDPSGSMREVALLVQAFLPRLGVRLDDTLTRTQRSEVNASLYRAGCPTLGTARTLGAYLRAQS